MILEDERTGEETRDLKVSGAGVTGVTGRRPRMGII